MAHRYRTAVPLSFFLLILPASSQTFEVASVKPAAPYKGGPIHIATTGGPGTDNPTRLTFSNATLTMVLQSAFDLQDTQKIDGPNWLNIDMFDIAATLPRSATKDQMRIMLQNLLAERFHMAWHREKQDLPAYVMFATKGRVRLAAAKDAASKPSHKEKGLPGIRTITCTNCPDLRASLCLQGLYVGGTGWCISSSSTATARPSPSNSVRSARSATRPEAGEAEKAGRRVRHRPHRPRPNLKLRKPYW